MEKTRKADAQKRRILETVYCAVGLVLYYVIYHVPLSLIKDSYGLFSGRKEPQSFTDFWGMVSAGYVRVVNGLYFYLGEKAAVITGLHFLCGFLSFLLLFLAVRRFYKPVLTYGIPAVFFAGCLALGVLLNYDAWILFAFGICFLFYLVLSLLFMILRLNYAPEQVIMTESLAEREKRESQAPKTIVNEKGETITLLANPLPGPKRHVKRTLDYDIQVPEEQMFYDLPGSDADDYDIR